MKPAPLQLVADWHYEQHGVRRHYVIEAWIADDRIGRAYGWFQPGARFVIDKIEMDRAHRSKGYGTTLIGELRAKACECRCRELVFAGVRRANRGAIRLYESLGASATSAAGELRDYVIALD